MKLIIAILAVLFISLQYKLWAGEGSVANAWHLGQKIAMQTEKNSLLARRNQMLEAEVKDLKKGMKAVEERARIELGMIKKGETFYQVIE